MGYLDGYFNSERPDYSAPNLTGLYQFVQSGYDAGKAKAQNQALAQLSQKAYTDTGDAQQQDIAQMMGISPQAGMQQAQFSQQQAAQKQATQQAMLERYGKAATAILQAKQRGDDATAEGIYQSLVPELQMHSAQTGGPPPPPSLDASVMPTVYKLASMYGQMPTPDKPLSVTPDTTLLDPVTHKVIYQGQGDAGSAVQGLTFNGMPVFRDKFGNLKDLRGNPIPQQGGNAPAAGNAMAVPQPGNATVTGSDGTTVKFDFAPGTPQAVIDQTYASARANGDIPQGAQPAPAGNGGGLQYTPNGKNADVIAQRAQQVAELKARGVTLTPDQQQAYLLTGKGPADLGSVSGDPLAGLSPQDQSLVKNIAAYKVLPSDLGRGKDRAEFIARATLINPDYNINNAQAAYAYLKDLGKSGPTTAGGQLQSLNALFDHLGTMINANSKLGNSSFPAVNWIGNEIATHTGSAAVNNWDQGRTFISQELAKLLKGGVASESEVNDLESKLSAAGSPQQRAAALSNIAQYAYGKISAMEDRRDRLLGKMSPGTSLMTPQAQAALKQAYALDNTQLPDLLPAQAGGSFTANSTTPRAQSSDPQLDALLKKYGGG